MSRMLRKLNPWSTDGGMAPSVPTDTVENVGEVLRLRKPSTKFGRSRSENDFYLDSPKFQKLISRRHAEIHRGEEKGKCLYTIQDSSLNGTFINDYRVSKQRQPLTHGDIITFGHLNGSRVKPGEHAPNRLAELSYIFEIDEKNSESGSDTDQESDADSRPESAQSPKAQSSDEDDEEEEETPGNKKKKSAVTAKNGSTAQPSVTNGEKEGEVLGSKSNSSLKIKPSKPGKDSKSPKSASKKPMVFDQNDQDASDSSEDSDDEEEEDDSDEDDSSDDESSAGEDKTNSGATPSVISETIYQTPRTNSSPAKAGAKRSRGRPTAGAGSSKKGDAAVASTDARAAGGSPLSSPPPKARRLGSATGETTNTPTAGKGRGAAAGTGGRPPGVLSEVKARKGSTAPVPITPTATPKAAAKTASPKGAAPSTASKPAPAKANAPSKASAKSKTPITTPAEKKKPPAPPPSAGKKGAAKKKDPPKGKGASEAAGSKKAKSKAIVEESDANSSDSDSSGNESASSGTKATQFMWHKEEYDVCASKKCLKPPGKRIQWVACDACDEWFHTECEGVSFEDVNKKDFEFFCGCSSKGGKRKK